MSNQDSYPPAEAPGCEVADVGPTLQIVPTETVKDDDMGMPRDQQLAWQMVDGFRAHYSKLHGRQPRQGIVRKFFDRYLAKVRASS